MGEDGKEFQDQALRHSATQKADRTGEAGRDLQEERGAALEGD